MPTKIRLQRHGRKKRPFYYIVVADSRVKRDGKFIERLGSYDPLTVPATITLDNERALLWLQRGAIPTDTVRAILSFKGVLYRKHLLRGVAKGALTQEEADKLYEKWLQEKEEKIRKRREAAQREKQKARQAIFEQEQKIREQMEAEQRKKLQEEQAEAAEQATEEAAAAEEGQPTAEAAESAETAQAEPAAASPVANTTDDTENQTEQTGNTGEEKKET